MSAVVLEAASAGALSPLAELLSPLAGTDFVELLRRRELTYRPRSNADRFAPVAGWAALQRIIEAGQQPAERDGIRVTKESQVVPPHRWMTDGKVDVAKLNAFVADGYSVVALRIEAHVPPLAAICDRLRHGWAKALLSVQSLRLAFGRAPSRRTTIPRTSLSCNSKVQSAGRCSVLLCQIHSGVCQN